MDTSKLPKWAQKHIRDLERQRDNAVNALNEHTDNQTESPFYFDDYVSTGERVGLIEKRVYIQTREVKVKHKGVELDVRITEEGIDMQWQGKHILDTIAFVPFAFNSARLISKENMR